jgi:hypothetical protein
LQVRLSYIGSLPGTDHHNLIPPYPFHLAVGKRFCGLLALDNEGSAIPRMKIWTACDRLTPSRSLRRGKSFGFVPN